MIRETYHQPDVVDFAYQIVALNNELQELREEVEYLREYKRKYHELLDESVQHNKEVCFSLLELARKGWP